MRQPFKLSSTLVVVSKSAFKSAPVRSFHTTKPATNFFTSRTTASANNLTKARNAFRQSRTYLQQPAVAPQGASLLQKLAVGGAMVGGTLVAINLVCSLGFRDSSASSFRNLHGYTKHLILIQTFTGIQPGNTGRRWNARIRESVSERNLYAYRSWYWYHRPLCQSHVSIWSHVQNDGYKPLDCHDWWSRT